MNKCGLCPVDKKPNEGKKKLFGVWACTDCSNRVKNISIKQQPPAIPRDTRPDSMKEDGAKHWEDTLQPRRQGEPSREFINKYPDEAKKIFTKKQILSSKNVWYNEPGAKSSASSKGGDLSSINPKALE